MTAPLPDAEAAALADELRHAAPSTHDVPRSVRAHRFDGAPARAGIRLSGLERLGDRLARRARGALEPLARCKTQVAAGPLVTEPFAGFCATLPAFCALSIYRLRPLKGSVLIVLDPGFVSTLVDSFYGGSGQRGGHAAAEFTATEERLAAKLADQIALLLGECWSEVTPFELQVAGRETNPAYLGMVRPDEMVIVQRLEVVPAGAAASRIDIVYPAAALRPVEALLAARLNGDEASPADAAWRERLGDVLAGVRLPVRSVLARPEVTVGQLLALKPGDVIPISLAQFVPLAVAGKPLAKGTIGEREGRAAMIVEQIGGRDP